MKIAYCGYDFFHTCLRYLLDNDHRIVKIFTFPCDRFYNYNDYIKQLAKSKNITVTQSAIADKDIQQLEKNGVECLITAGYSFKVPDLTQTSIKGFNIHPTLLPQGRGVWPLPWIILKQLQQSGVTLHKLSNDWDAGDILLQQSYNVSEGEVLESLSCKIQLLATQLLQQVMENLDHYWSAATPQTGDASLWPMPDMKQRYIDWNMPIKQIDAIVRAFGKFGAYAVFDNTLFNIYDISVWQQLHTDEPGTKVHITNTETVIAASDGLVCLRYFRKCEDQTLIDSL